ncbi:MAG TPA: hypothetical protein VFV94_12335 [Polyangiaceae bacterium]|jgi:hypothetical protein|nr:hypothetical protein [Polyangiaceae bacterium]
MPFSSRKHRAQARSGGTPTGSHRVRWGLALLSLPGLVACGNPVQRQLEGRWLGDSVEAFEQRELSRATGWAKGVSFEFTGAKVTVTIPAEEPRSAPYKVTGVHASDVRLAVQRPDGKSDPLHLRIDDERSVRWMIDASHAVVLRRDE